jgi:class 3 adenylate cyclase
MPDEPSSMLERKLATILSADVAGYSRLMAEDEEQTLRIFRGHREIFESVVAMHRGRIFNTAGDAILAEFPSAVEAVRCATEIQTAVRTRTRCPDRDRARRDPRAGRRNAGAQCASRTRGCACPRTG